MSMSVDTCTHTCVKFVDVLLGSGLLRMIITLRMFCQIDPTFVLGQAYTLQPYFKVNVPLFIAIVLGPP